jgi:hypothetical protein
MAKTTTRTKNDAERTSDYTLVTMVGGYIQEKDALRHVEHNLAAFRRLARKRGARGSRIAAYWLARIR